MLRKFFKGKSRPTELQREIDKVIDDLVALRSLPICRQKIALEEDPAQLRALSSLAGTAAAVFDQLLQEVAFESGLGFQSEVWNYANIVRNAVESTVVRDLQLRANEIEAERTASRLTAALDSPSAKPGSVETCGDADPRAKPKHSRLLALWN
jgi:hypothetical protein